MLHPRISLKAKWIEGSQYNGWVTIHNAILDRYFADNGITINGNATAILAMATGIHGFLDYHDSASVHDHDYYVIENVITPLVAAFRDALNLDLGGLDGGTLSHWIETIATDYGIEG